MATQMKLFVVTLHVVTHEPVIKSIEPTELNLLIDRVVKAQQKGRFARIKMGENIDSVKEEISRELVPVKDFS